MRLCPKTCQTPEGPVNEKSLYEGFVTFREGIRWQWFFNKNSIHEEVVIDNTRQPMDERTDISASVAQDFPEIEAFLSGVYRDMVNPSLRKKVKGNLTQEQHNLIKEGNIEYPTKNISKMGG